MTEISIRCAHCTGRHGSVAEVRNCSTRVMTTEPVVIFEQANEPGMYRTDGEVYLVVTSESGRLYAKKLVTEMKGDAVHKLAFEYDTGSIYKISKFDRMSVEDVAKLGKTTGHCWVCARKLTVKKSVEAGIGPICAQKV